MNLFTAVFHCVSIVTSISTDVLENCLIADPKPFA